VDFHLVRPILPRLFLQGRGDCTKILNLERKSRSTQHCAGSGDHLKCSIGWSIEQAGPTIVIEFRSGSGLIKVSREKSNQRQKEGKVEMQAYLPILIVFIFVLGFAVTNILLSHLIGRRRDTRAKLMPYECGMDPVGSAHQRFSVKFYLVAMLFILFDIEAIFLVPWAVVFRSLIERLSRPFVFFEMMAFIAVLFVGYIYVWKKGLFEWNRG
jgi:NADH-quinone oxidoreductase subunit A